MPKIPQNTIDKIRDLADIVDVISTEIELKRRGINYFGVCPFHDENTPSFSVSPSKQIYHCFGCGNGGNVFTFIMEFQKLTFFEAIKFLANKYNVVLEIANSNSSSNEYSFLKKIHEDSTLLFQQNLFSDAGKDPLQYLMDRNLSESVIRKFRIGFAFDSWNNLYNKISFDYKDKFQNIMKTGLFIRSDKGTFDRFRSRIIFPIFHQSGGVIAFGGRDYKKNDLAKYLNSPETAIYQKSNTLYGLHVTKDDIRKKGYALLVEGYMDLLQLYQAGIKPVVSVSGTSLTKNHANLISKHVKKVILLYDGDSAGANAVLRAGFILLQAGIEAYVVRPPDRLDPDDWLLEKGPDALKKAIQSPMEFLDFHLEFYKAKKLRGVQKSDYLHDIIGNIKTINDSIIKNEIIRDLAEKMRIQEVDLLQILNLKRNFNKAEIVDVSHNLFEFKTKLQRAELELIKILINSNFKARKVLKKNIGLNLFSHELLIKIISKILADETIENSKLVEHFPEKKEREFISQLLIEGEDEEYSEKVVADCIKTIKSIAIKNRIEELRFVIQANEKSGEGTSKELKEVMKLQKELIEYRQ